MHAITDKTATERGSFDFEITMTDVDDSVIPAASISSAVWSLVDEQDAIIDGKDRVAISSPTNPIRVELDDAELQILGSEASREFVTRFYVLEVVYTSVLGSGKKLNEQVSFVIENLHRIT